MVQHFMGLVGNEWVDQDQLDASPVLSRITVLSHRLENSIKEGEEEEEENKQFPLPTALRGDDLPPVLSIWDLAARVKFRTSWEGFLLKFKPMSLEGENNF